MSLAYAESDSYSDGPRLEPWQYPAPEQPLYYSLPLREGQQALDFALQEDVAMVNEHAVLLTKAEQKVLDILLRNRYRYLRTNDIFDIAADEGETSVKAPEVSDYLGELAAKLRFGDQRFLGRIKVADSRQAYRIVDAVVHTGSIKESAHVPLKSGPLVVEDPFWHEKQNCANVPIEQMVPENDTVAERRAVEEYCGHCSVKRSCLTDALINDDHYGARGATTGVQRERMLRTRRAQETGYIMAQNMQLMAGRDTNEARVVRRQRKPNLH